MPRRSAASRSSTTPGCARRPVAGRPRRGVTKTAHVDGAEQRAGLAEDADRHAREPLLQLVDGGGESLLPQLLELAPQRTRFRDRGRRHVHERLAEEPLEPIAVVGGEQNLAARAGVQREALSEPGARHEVLRDRRPGGRDPAHRPARPRSASPSRGAPRSAPRAAHRRARAARCPCPLAASLISSGPRRTRSASGTRRSSPSSSIVWIRRRAVARGSPAARASAETLAPRVGRRRPEERHRLLDRVVESGSLLRTDHTRIVRPRHQVARGGRQMICA